MLEAWEKEKGNEVSSTYTSVIANKLHESETEWDMGSGEYKTHSPEGQDKIESILGDSVDEFPKQPKLMVANLRM